MPKITRPDTRIPVELRNEILTLVEQFGVGILARMLEVSRNVPRQWLLGLRTPTIAHRAVIKALLTTRTDTGSGI